MLEVCLHCGGFLKRKEGAGVTYDCLSCDSSIIVEVSSKEVTVPKSSVQAVPKDPLLAAEHHLAHAINALEEQTELPLPITIKEILAALYTVRALIRKRNENQNTPDDPNT